MRQPQCSIGVDKKKKKLTPLECSVRTFLAASKLRCRSITNIDIDPRALRRALTLTVPCLLGMQSSRIRRLEKRPQLPIPLRPRHPDPEPVLRSFEFRPVYESPRSTRGARGAARAHSRHRSRAIDFSNRQRARCDPPKIPLGPASRSGPLQLQIMLDRAGFSPGIIDGTWGKNAAGALKYFRAANDMDSAATRTVDKATYDKLAANAPNPLIKTYQVTADDMEGPFLPIPEDVYAQAKLKCLCYSSPAEELAEQFHTSETMLKQLNPKVDLKSIAPTSLQVPNVGYSLRSDGATQQARARRKSHIEEGLHIRDRRVWEGCRAFPPLHLGAGYDPSPTGAFRVTKLSRDPASTISLPVPKCPIRSQG